MLPTQPGTAVPQETAGGHQCRPVAATALPTASEQGPSGDAPGVKERFINPVALPLKPSLPGGTASFVSGGR